MTTKPRKWKRRRVLAYGLGGTAALAVGGAAVGTWLWNRAVVDTAGAIDFDTELKIPPLAKKQTDSQGRTVFDLQLKRGESAFKTGVSTKTWGVNGDYLGPTLRAARGDEVVVNVRNSLGETSSVHWHGMHLPAKADGGPHQPVAAHDTWTTGWTVNQPAATLWYHPHPHGETARHVYRGLAGLFILDDEAEAELDLPRDYGVDDIPVIIQDRKFDGDNQFDEEDNLTSSVGVLGDEILVNGTMAPYQTVTTRRVRLRLLNGSNARVYNLGFADDREFHMIGSDGGLLPESHSRTRLLLSPGERAELVVTFTEGERAVLRGFPSRLSDDPFDSRFSGFDDTLDILQFRAADRLSGTAKVPGELVEMKRLEESEASKTRRMEMAMYSINDKAMDMTRIDFGAAKGSTEVWEIANWDGVLHNFHVHDVQFQVLSVGGKEPPPELRGWKDTVNVERGRDVRIAMEFADYSDPDMPYMYHCHILRHEDLGLMGQFVVLDSDEEIGTVATADHSDHHGG